MLRLPEASAQQPLPLFFPAVTELEESHGIVRQGLSRLPHIHPDRHITLAHLAYLHGQQFGSTDNVTAHQDPPLELAREDFGRAHPTTILRGLIIPQHDQRYKDKKTEQIVRVKPRGDRHSAGVVFPSDQFSVVARSPEDLVRHAIARTREANAGNPDFDDIEARAGRCAGHVLLEKMTQMHKLNTELASTRAKVLIPLQNEASRNGGRYPWSSRFKAKNLDRIRRAFDEEWHEAIDTAALNLNIGTIALKKAHLAGMSALYRNPSNHQRSVNTIDIATLLRTYTQERRKKISYSMKECNAIFQTYQPFLEDSSS